MSVPGQMNDIKVLITKRAFTLDVIFKPAAQFEFSANEVRMRLAKSDQFKGIHYVCIMYIHTVYIIQIYAYNILN